MSSSAGGHYGRINRGCRLGTKASNHCNAGVSARAGDDAQQAGLPDDISSWLTDQSHPKPPVPESRVSFMQQHARLAGLGLACSGAQQPAGSDVDTAHTISPLHGPALTLSPADQVLVADLCAVTCYWSD